MKAPVKLQRKQGKLARKLVIFGDQNARTECHRQFLCAQKNVDQKGPSEVSTRSWAPLLSEFEPTIYGQRCLASPLGQSVSCFYWPIYRPLALILLKGQHFLDIWITDHILVIDKCNRYKLTQFAVSFQRYAVMLKLQQTEFVAVAVDSSASIIFKSVQDYIPLKAKDGVNTNILVSASFKN